MLDLDRISQQEGLWKLLNQEVFKTRSPCCVDDGRRSNTGWPLRPSSLDAGLHSLRSFRHGLSDVDEVLSQVEALAESHPDPTQLLDFDLVGARERPSWVLSQVPFSSALQHRSPRVEFVQISFAYPPQPGGTRQSWLLRKLASSAFSMS